MEPPADRHALSRLGLGLALLVSTTLADASANRPAIHASAEEPESGAMVDRATAIIAHPAVIIPTASPDGNDSSLNAPCLHGYSGTQSHTLDTNDKRCSKAPVSPQGLGFQFGRKLRTPNRMLGDFDGLMLKYDLGNLALNGIAGLPSASGKEQIDPQRQLYGLSAASGRLANWWNLTGYYMQLQASDQHGRSAVGGAIRYSQANRSLLISADYNLLSDSLSRFMVSSAWKVRATSTLSSTFGIHRDYLTSPQNKYLQQSIASTEGWAWGLPLERIKALSSTPSTDVSTLGLSVSHAFSRQIRLKSDLAILNVSKETGSNEQTGPLSDFNEYYFYCKLSGKDLLLPGASSAISLRHNVSEESRLSSSLLDGSYTVNRQWRLKPRLQIKHRDNLTDNSTQWIASPSVKVEYRWDRQSRVNFKATGEWRKDQDPDEQEYYTSYAVSLGYLANF